MSQPTSLRQWVAKHLADAHAFTADGEAAEHTAIMVSKGLLRPGMKLPEALAAADADQECLNFARLHYITVHSDHPAPQPEF